MITKKKFLKSASIFDDFDDRTNIIKELINKRYVKKVLLSHPRNFFFHKISF